jgi:polyphosphate kinase 2 (PPK2 family)
MKRKTRRQSPPRNAKPAKPEKQEDLSRKDYESELRRLHGELVKLQRWVLRGLKVGIVFEGRDGAGKGGVIKAITERVSPRVFRVVALPAPTEREKSQMYMQRYVRHLPAAGEVVIFDRSWYNRAGVERVMGFSNQASVDRFLGGSTPLSEGHRRVGDHPHLSTEAGHPEEQTRRSRSAHRRPRKLWKLSPMDLKS